jgi:hypothetical protein
MIPERCVVIMTSVEMDDDEQVNSRQLYVTTDNSPEHKAKIIRLLK